METGWLEAARAVLHGLVEQKVANRGSRARAWAREALAWIVQHEIHFGLTLTITSRWRG